MRSSKADSAPRNAVMTVQASAYVLSSIMSTSPADESRVVELLVGTISLSSRTLQGWFVQEGHGVKGHSKGFEAAVGQVGQVFMVGVGHMVEQSMIEV